MDSELKMMGLGCAVTAIAIVQWALVAVSIVVIFVRKDHRMMVWTATAIFTLCNFLFSRFAKRMVAKELAD
jgi:hypothetical protein